MRPQREVLAVSSGALALLALGVVYGDIGTSPLYAIQVCFAGTHGVGASPANVMGVLSLIFWPTMLVWFGALAVLGIRGILQAPEILRALNPIYGVRFFEANGLAGFLVLGAVFLVVTGGEALYADMGHFSERAIQIGWFGV